MTYKNSILELILTDTNVLTEEHRYRTNAYPCDDTYPSYHRYPRPMECFDLS